MPDNATIDQIDRITVRPDVCNGKPTVRGMRMTVATALGYPCAV